MLGSASAGLEPLTGVSRGDEALSDLGDDGAFAPPSEKSLSTQARCQALRLTSSPARSKTHFPTALRGGDGIADSSAFAMAFAVMKRCAGSLFKPWRMMLSRMGGISGRSALGGCASPSSML